MSKELFIIALLAISAISWNSTGHYIIARLAEIEIMEADESLQKELVGLLALNAVHSREKDYPFVEAATYSSDIRHHNWTIFNSWHYAVNYLMKKDSKVDTKNLPSSPQDIVFAINEAKNTLRNTKVSRIEDRFGKSFMLRHLIHLVGDVHQPLHNVSFISNAIETGDMGGNLFEVDATTGETLHDLWDNCLNLFVDLEGPLDKKSFEALDDIVKNLRKTFSRSTLQDRIESTGSSVKKWSEEARKIAVKDIYSDMKDKQKFDDAYTKSKGEIVKTQLALAGYRLADAIIELFKDGNRDRLKSHKKADASEDDNADGSDVSGSSSSSSKKPRAKSAEPKKDIQQEPAAPATKTRNVSADTKVAVEKKQKPEKSNKILIDTLSSTDSEEIFEEEDIIVVKKKSAAARKTQEKPARSAGKGNKFIDDDEYDEYDLSDEYDEEMDYFQFPKKRKAATSAPKSGSRAKRYHQENNGEVIAPENDDHVTILEDEEEKGTGIKNKFINGFKSIFKSTGLF